MLQYCEGPGTFISNVTLLSRDYLSVYKWQLYRRSPSCECDQMQNCEGSCETIIIRAGIRAMRFKMAEIWLV